VVGRMRRRRRREEVFTGSFLVNYGSRRGKPISTRKEKKNKREKTDFPGNKLTGIRTNKGRRRDGQTRLEVFHGASTDHALERFLLSARDCDLALKRSLKIQQLLLTTPTPPPLTVIRVYCTYN